MTFDKTISGVVGEGGLYEFSRKDSAGDWHPCVNIKLTAWQVDDETVAEGVLRLEKNFISKEEIKQLKSMFIPFHTVSVLVSDSTSDQLDSKEADYYFDSVSTGNTINSALAETSSNLLRASEPAESWHQAFLGLRISVNGDQERVSQFASEVNKFINDNGDVNYRQFYTSRYPNNATVYRYHKPLDQAATAFTAPSLNIHLQQSPDFAVIIVRGTLLPENDQRFLKDFYDSIVLPVAGQLNLKATLDDKRMPVRDAIRKQPITLKGITGLMSAEVFYSEYYAVQIDNSYTGVSFNGYVSQPIAVKPWGGILQAFELSESFVSLEAPAKKLVKNSLKSFLKQSTQLVLQLTPRVHQEYKEFCENTGMEDKLQSDQPQAVWATLEPEGNAMISVNGSGSNMKCEIAFVLERHWDNHAYRFEFISKDGKNFSADFDQY